MLHVFVACDDATFEVYFDTVIVYDDLFHQLLEYGAVIRVHDAAVNAASPAFLKITPQMPPPAHKRLFAAFTTASTD